MRNYPLFIIDTSRCHGRGREVDYIACTSAQLPWVGEVTYLSPEELAIDQDWSSKNPMCLYSEPNTNGIRIKLKAIDIPSNCKMAELKQLLRRAMKEWITRLDIVTFKAADEPGNEAVAKFCDVLLGQNATMLRDNPDGPQARMVRSILLTIKSRFNEQTR